MKWFILLLTIFPFVSVYANEVLSIEDFVQSALPFDVTYQSSILDEKSAIINRDAAFALWRRSLQVAPYQTQYSVVSPSSLKSSAFKETGLQWTLAQGTPWGTNLQIGIEHGFENTRQEAPAKEKGLSLGLSQSLWKNQFGEIFEFQKQQADSQLEIARRTLSWRKNEACLRASGAFVQSYALSEKLKMAQESLMRAEELKTKSELAQKRGQMSQLEWLGVQSDYWNMKALQFAAEQAFVSSQMELQKFSPEIKIATPQNPRAIFEKIKLEVDKIVEPDESLEELIMERQVSVADAKLKEAKSNAAPDLDLKLSKKWNQGSFASESYRDSEWGASLQLTWKFGDPSVEVPLRMVEIEKNKLFQELAHERRVHSIHFASGKQDLENLIKQMQFAEERDRTLTIMVKENLKRFYQGRIEFQIYLRTKEQWQESQKQNIETKAQYWKRLLEFALDQNRSLSLCGGSQ